MTFIRSMVSELFGLFVDDGSLALLTLFLIGVVTALVKLASMPALAGAALLLAGCLAILCFSVYRAAAER